MQWSAGQPHKLSVDGSNPSSARSAYSQPPRGALWLILMTIELNPSITEVIGLLAGSLIHNLKKVILSSP